VSVIIKKLMTISFYISAGWLVDGSGESARQNALLSVRNGIIVSIKEPESTDLNSADIIDLSYYTLLPGLVDAHVHLFMSGTSNPEVRQQQLETPFENIKKVISRHIHQQLAHGVVAVRDGGDYAGHALRYKTECLPSEKLPICLRSAGKAWRASGRYGRLIGRPPSGGNSLAQAIAHGQESLDHVKIVNSGLNSLTKFGKKTLPQFNADQLRAAVRTAGNHGLRVMVHANGELPVKLAIEAGCHSIEHGFFMGKDNLRRMADRQVMWVPTAYTMKAYHESLDTISVEGEVALRNLEHQMNQISLAMQYGVPIAIGTDCGSLGVHHGSAFKEELRLLIQAGMTLEKGIQCATQNSAKTLDVADNFGRLGTGMPATFVAARGDPSGLPDTLNAPVKIFIRGEAWKPDAMCLPMPLSPEWTGYFSEE